MLSTVSAQAHSALLPLAAPLLLAAYAGIAEGCGPPCGIERDCVFTVVSEKGEKEISKKQA